MRGVSQMTLILVAGGALGFTYGYFLGTDDIMRYIIVALEASAVGFLVSHIYYSLRVRREERQMNKNFAAIRTVLEEAQRQGALHTGTKEPGPGDDAVLHVSNGFPRKSDAGPVKEVEHPTNE